jgi:AAA family ATP:ADP antiporter
VALVATLMFVTLAGITIGESAVNALFFDRIGTQALPLMYLAQAGATLVAMFALTTVLERVSHRAVYIWSPLLLAAVVVIERGVLLTDVRWIYPVLWMTVAFASLSQAIGLWGTAGSVVDTRQAKRLFPIFGAGGILGAVVGGLLTRPLAGVVGAENLLLIWVGGLLVAAVLCRLSLGPGVTARGVAARRHGSMLHDIKNGFTHVRRSRLLIGMAAAAVLFSVLFYSLFLPFATVSTERFTDTDALAGFFGLVGAVITGCAFLISVLLTNRLFARFGVTAMVLVLPLLYLGSFTVLLVASGFITVVVLRVMTGVWLQGVASPAWETLVNVVPDDRRDQTRAFLNGGPAQVGTAIAGVVALVGQDVLTGRQFAVIGMVAAVLTLVAALVIHRSYGDALLGALLAARPQVFEKPTAWTPIPLDIDAQATIVLANAMRSDDIRTRRTAFQLASGLRADALTTEIVWGLDDADPIVRLAAVRSLDVSTAPGRQALLGMVDDVDPSVAAAASSQAAGLSDAHAATKLDRLLGDSDARVRALTLEQLGAAPAALAADLAERLLDDPDTRVRAAALDRLAQADPDRALAPTLAGMRDPDPAVRLAAGRALGATGDRGVEHVLAALLDPERSAAGVEAARLLEPEEEIERVHVFVRAATARAGADHALVASIPQTPEAEALLRDAVLDRGRRVARSALWAASMLVSKRVAMHTAIERLDGPAPLRASALETLETAGATKLVAQLLALWEPIATRNDDAAWLAQVLQDDDGTVQRCAELVRARREGDAMSSPMTMSTIERVLILRGIPLFADLSPADLEGVARIAEERGYADAETIAREGELGDEMHIVIDGVIRVVTDLGGDEREIARRSAGDVVGEMSIITRSPRIASLVADGVVRTIRIGHSDFESMLRERPDLAIGVMRVLADRLAESTRSGPAS